VVTSQDIFLESIEQVYRWNYLAGHKNRKNTKIIFFVTVQFCERLILIAILDLFGILDLKFEYYLSFVFCHL